MTMRRSLRASAGFVLPVAACALWYLGAGDSPVATAFGAGPGVALPGVALPAPGGTGAGPRVVARTGDPAPVDAILTGFGDPIAPLPGGGVVFTDEIRSSLFLKRAGTTSTVAWAGEATPAGSRFELFLDVAAGSGGAIAFIASLADGREGVFRIAASTLGGTEPPPIEPILLIGDEVPLRDGPAVVAGFDGLGVDGNGGAIVQAFFESVPGALVEIDPQGVRRVRLEPGDPVGNALLAWFLPAPPGVSGAGSVAFLAVDDRGRQVVGTQAPGGGAAARFLASGGQGAGDSSVLHVRPAINDRGDIAFIWRVGSTLQATRAQRITGDEVSMTVGRAGFAIPGGGVIEAVAEAGPAIAADGTVSFIAFRTDDGGGVYAAGPVGGLRPVIQDGDRVEDRFYGSSAYLSQPGVAIGPEGTLHFHGYVYPGPAILAAAGGVIRVEADYGESAGPSRFVTFTSTAAQFMSAGPAAAPGGLLIFDARVSGGRRGLYALSRDGAVTPVAIGNVPYFGSSGYEGLYFSFHSINASGTYAFVGRENGSPGSQVGLYYGHLGGGPPVRLADVGPAIPGVGFGQRGEPISFGPIAPPTRVNAAGQVAVILDDPAGDALFCFDGDSMVRVVATGDAAPGGDTFTGLYTGSQFLGREIAPTIDDAGRITFGGQTARGDNALYRAACVAGGGVPDRLLGAGDTVEGGRFSPFELQNLETDTAGRVLFESIDSDEYVFGTFLKDGDGVAPLARRFDPLPDGHFVFDVTARLALAGPRGVAYGVSSFSGGERILIRDPASPDAPGVLVAVGMAAPEGGVYLGIGGGQTSGLRRVETGRLASDGQGALAFVAATDEWPEILVIDGLAVNRPPVADAGDDIVAECAGPEGATVVLDGGGSSDPEGDSLAWTWTGPFGTIEGANPTVTIPLGTWTVRLVVGDGQTISDPDTVTVEVRDHAPPLLRAIPTPSVLWPPDRRMAPVGFDVTVTDRCDPSPSVTLTGVTSSEAGMGGTQFDGADLGTDDRAIRLQAARAGNGPGRFYFVTYSAIDRSGNPATATMTVTVPHDQRSRP
jgi:hypothetical protein